MGPVVFGQQPLIFLFTLLRPLELGGFSCVAQCYLSSTWFDTVFLSKYGAGKNFWGAKNE